MKDPLIEKLKAEKISKKIYTNSDFDSKIKDMLKKQKTPANVEVVQPPTFVNANVSATQLKGKTINVENAYVDSVKMLKQKIKKDNVDIFNVLETVQKGEIVVVKGSYDSIETILDASGLPYNILGSKADLKKAKLMFVNCPGSYNIKQNEIKKFVENGGYIITTDWALDKVVNSNFGHIKYTGKSTPNDVVDVTVPDPENFYVKRAFPKGIKPAWWLEGSSHAIGIKDKNKVKVLIRSDELEKKYGSDVIGATFAYGKGRVFHFISHFKLQQSKEYLDPSKKDSNNFAKNILDLNDQEIDSLDINKKQNYAAVETAYSSAMIIHNIIAAKKLDYNKD